MGNKHEKVCETLSYTLTYIEQFLILASAITRCISISTFVSLLGIPTRITTSSIGLTICAIAAAIKTC